jgi:hypothetical protein
MSSAASVNAGRTGKVGNLHYCAESDTGWDELGSLVRLLRDLALREEHPRE